MILPRKPLVGAFRELALRLGKKGKRARGSRAISRRARVPGDGRAPGAPGPRRRQRRRERRLRAGESSLQTPRAAAAESSAGKMAEAGTGFLEQLKSCIVWSWTYLWTVWFFIVLFLVYILRVPLKINDNLSTGKARAAGPAALAPPPPRKVSATRPGPRPAGAAGRALEDVPGPAHRMPAATRGHPPRTRRLGWRGRRGVRGRLAAFAAPRPADPAEEELRRQAGPASGCRSCARGARRAATEETEVGREGVPADAPLAVCA